MLLQHENYTASGSENPQRVEIQVCGFGCFDLLRGTHLVSEEQLHGEELRSLPMSKYVDEPDVDQVMGRRGRDTEDEDSDSGDEMDFRKQRQQLKQQQQQQRASTVPPAGLLAAEEDEEEGEDARADPTHAHTAALCEACRAGDVEALKGLLAVPGTRVSAADAEGESPLHVAARAGHSACVRQLAAASADLNLQSAQQAPP